MTTATEVIWCAICGSQHRSRLDCPGELLATGPERYGRSITVKTVRGGKEVYGVMIAESGSLWRARILTFPKMLWSVPGSRGTIKFVGKSPRDAEQKAVEFIREFCRSRRFSILDEIADVKAGPVKRESARTLNPRAAKDERHPHALRADFGKDRATLRATTTDLSVGGLFLITDKPFAEGTSLRMVLHLENYMIPLSGIVAWGRSSDENGKPAGMGIQLRNAPPMYVRYVRALDEQGNLS